MRIVYTRSYERLNEVDFRAALDSKLEEQRSEIKFQFSEDEKSCHIS